MAVVAHHLSPLHFRGAIGVVLFFVLSGYLMGRLYLIKDFGVREVWRYLTARFARIYPLFAAVLITAFLLNSYAGFDVFGLQPWQLDRHLALLGDGFTVWTIAVECYFYLLFLIFWYLSASNRLGIPTLIGVFVILATIAFFVDGRINILRYLHIFVLGMIVARISTEMPDRLARYSPYILPVAAISFVILSALPIDVYGNPAVVLVTGALVLGSVNAPTSVVGRALSVAPVVWLGEISYGIYLLHRFSQEFVERLTGSGEKSWVLFGLATAMTLVMATIVYNFFEAPMRDFLRNLSRSLEARFSGTTEH